MKDGHKDTNIDTIAIGFFKVWPGINTTTVAKDSAVGKESAVATPGGGYIPIHQDSRGPGPQFHPRKEGIFPSQPGLQSTSITENIGIVNKITSKRIHSAGQFFVIMLLCSNEKSFS